MYPYELFLGLDLYSLFMIVGVMLCMVFIRLQGDWRGFSAKFQNLILLDTVPAVVLGYGAAVLFQAFYNYMDSGKFEIVQNTGATFYGGLIGGTALFIIIYFVAGHFLFPDGYHKPRFRAVSDMAAACITVAHGFGRLGCLMAGCCHGRETDAWYGILMNIPGDGYDGKVRVIPVQLYEAIFLLALSFILLALFKRGKKYLMPSYMIAYSIWRFVAETMRADDRGATVVDFLSPSQLISVLLLAGGLLLLGIELYLDDRARRAESPADTSAADTSAAATSAAATSAADTSAASAPGSDSMDADEAPDSADADEPRDTAGEGADV